MSNDSSFFGFNNPGGADSRAKANKLYGLAIGIVTDNVHPDGDYRVRVKYPWLPGSDQAFWARISTIMASKGGVGAFFLPEKDDEVLVAFINGDFEQPVVVGRLWGGVDKPSIANKDGKSATGRFHGDHADHAGKTEAKKNDITSFSTRTKHEIVLNDNASEPRVGITSGQKHRIVLNDKGNQPDSIEIYDGKNENYLLISCKEKKITIESKTGDILIKAKKNITLDAGEKIITTSVQNTEMTTKQNFKMTATSNMELKASGTGLLQSSGTMTIKGSTVNIN